MSSRLEFHFLSAPSPARRRGRRGSRPISDHNLRSRLEVEEVFLCGWNKDGKFLGKHLLPRVSVTSLSSLLPAGQTESAIACSVN